MTHDLFLVSRRGVLKGSLGTALTFLGGRNLAMAALEYSLIGFRRVDRGGGVRRPALGGGASLALRAAHHRLHAHAHGRAGGGRAVVYMGDDAQNECVYKFVSRDRFDAADRRANFSLLTQGTLYVARFNGDGSGEWRELVQGRNGLDQAAGFATQADVLVQTRLAADRAGGTKMDRPEWIAVHPFTREVYVTLTNNSTRGAATGTPVDPANPRAGNVFGHIVRWQESGSDAAALGFRWSIFCLCGDPRATDSAKRGTVKGDAFGSPDGLWFDTRGLLWIQTDVSTSTLNSGDYANLGNNMMLAADPVSGQIKRFLTGPRNCEITGVTGTPDGRAMFVNIQHPGEPASGDSNPAATGAISTWPDGPGIARPRSATVAIRRTDGGPIGA
jgi:secreted PhoX family phosphatase